MNEALVQRHNERVKPGDLVYHLGDMFWRTLPTEECRRILDRLNGVHYYVWGNHEEHLEANFDLQKRFIWCRDIARVFPNKDMAAAGIPKIVLCHYAMRVWRGSHQGAWHLYGHTHAELPENDSLSFDVGVDARNYYPISVEEVAEIMKRKKQNKTDLSRDWVAPIAKRAVIEEHV